MQWAMKEVSRNVHEVRVNTKSREPFWALLISDVHWDNPHCNRELLKRHLEEAKEHEAPVFCFGDFFCAMQGKYDRRSNKDDIRPEHQHGDYLDRLVQTATEWLTPYKDIIALISPGNHETSILERHETCLLTSLTSALRQRGGVTRLGGYSGWLRFQLRRTAPNSTDASSSLRMHYLHGFGGGGPITRGLIDWSRTVMQANADVYCQGHIHYRNIDEVPCVHLTQTNELETRPRKFVRCGTYKDDYGDGHGGWHVEKGRGPRPLGGWWMRLEIDRKSRIRMAFQETES